MFVSLLSFFAIASVVIGPVSALEGWTYVDTDSTCAGTNSDPCGPEYWGKVNGASACSGMKQTPVDVSQATTNPSLTLPTYHVKDGGCKDWVQFNKQYSFELGFYEDGEYICDNLGLTYNNEEYSLLQMHFHSPSEHTFGGGFAAAEAHFVHLNKNDGTLLVLGVMLEVTSSPHIGRTNNTFLNTLWKAGEGSLLSSELTHIHHYKTAINPYQGFLPPKSAHFRYNGSLTTPPCSEIVKWILFEQPVYISSDDLNIIRGTSGALSNNLLSNYGNSNRPVQPLNGRVVEYYPAATATSSATSTTTGMESSDSDDEDNYENVAIAAIVIACVSMAFAVAAAFGFFLTNNRYVAIHEKVVVDKHENA